MLVKEYQVKQLFKKHEVPLLRGMVAYTPDEAKSAAETIGGTAWVIKAQVAAEGRSTSFFENRINPKATQNYKNIRLVVQFTNKN